MLRATLSKESKGMEDDLIFVLSLHILALFLVDLYNSHIFGLECLVAIGNTVATMYFYLKNKKEKQ